MSHCCVMLCCVVLCHVMLGLYYRLLDGAVVLADVVDDARDAKGTSKTQQVSQESECDAEDERSAEGFP